MLGYGSRILTSETRVRSCHQVLYFHSSKKVSAVISLFFNIFFTPLWISDTSRQRTGKVMCVMHYILCIKSGAAAEKKENTHTFSLTLIFLNRV